MDDAMMMDLYYALSEGADPEELAEEFTSSLNEALARIKIEAQAKENEHMKDCEAQDIADALNEFAKKYYPDSPLLDMDADSVISIFEMTKRMEKISFDAEAFDKKFKELQSKIENILGAKF